MNNNIILEWNEEKRQRNIAERGIDFIDSIDIFNDSNTTFIWTAEKIKAKKD